jgi:cytosine/uracil/thiamine/allantoin permease
MSKCALLYFVIGVTVTTASYAFFGQMMQMPGKAFQTGSQMFMPVQESKCDCRCAPG